MRPSYPFHVLRSAMPLPDFAAFPMKFSVLCVLCTFGLAQALSAEVTETFQQSYPISPTGVLHLENVNGFVEIIAWDKNEVRVEAVKTAPAAEHLARITLKIDSTPDRLAIETQHKKTALLVDTWRGQVRYTLHVPATIQLDRISVINEGIRVEGVTGPVHLKTVNGPIEATGLASAGRFETVNGKISAAFTRLTGVDALSLRTVNGRCDLTIPKDAPFSLDSTSVSGGVRTDMPVKIEKSGLASLRGRSGEGGPKIEFNSVNGELALHSQEP
jgi:DUF4097 and DUF4098 domain-containing protein YvlB